LVHVEQFKGCVPNLSEIQEKYWNHRIFLLGMLYLLEDAGEGGKGSVWYALCEAGAAYMQRLVD
jgi:hypothetical protein